MEFLQNWIKDRAVENRVEDVRKPGEYNATTWDKIVGGLTGTNVEQAVDDHTKTVNNKKTTDYLTSIGETRQSLGLSEDSTLNDATGAYTLTTRTRADEKEKTKHKRGLEPYKMELAASREQRAGELALAREKLSQSNNLAILQLADNKDARIADLQYQKQRDRKSDQQYNERMEMLDRKDRKQAMSSLAAGIAALGAAFAI
jgi:hypothetical protein